MWMRDKLGAIDDDLDTEAVEQLLGVIRAYLK